MNSENKSQLVDVMNDVWSSQKFAPKLAWKKIITVPHGNCYLLASEDEDEDEPCFQVRHHYFV